MQAQYKTKSHMSDDSASPGVSRTRTLPSVRRAALMKLLDRRGSISVADAAERLHVSPMTIRRDLACLAGEGLLTRDHGGANGIALDASEPIFELRARAHRAAKRAIAEAALALVRSGMTVGIDTGSTTHAFAERLALVSGIRIFSSNVRTSAVLAAGRSPVYSLGGSIRPRELSVFGPITSAQLNALWLDTAFIGVAGLMENGIFDYSLEDTEIKRLFIERANQVVVLCDASKFGLRSLALVAELSRIHVLVTNRMPDPPLAERLASEGVEIIVADDRVDEDEPREPVPGRLFQPEVPDV